MVRSLVVLVLTGDVSEGSKRLLVMNVQLPAQLALVLAAILATVAIAVAGGTTLRCPIGAVVAQGAASPAAMRLASNMRRAVCREAVAIAELQRVVAHSVGLTGQRLTALGAGHLDAVVLGVGLAAGVATLSLIGDVADLRAKVLVGETCPERNFSEALAARQTRNSDLPNPRTGAAIGRAVGLLPPGLTFKLLPTLRTGALSEWWMWGSAVKRTVNLSRRGLAPKRFTASRANALNHCPIIEQKN